MSTWWLPGWETLRRRHSQSEAQLTNIRQTYVEFSTIAVKMTLTGVELEYSFLPDLNPLNYKSGQQQNQIWFQHVSAYCECARQTRSTYWANIPAVRRYWQEETRRRRIVAWRYSTIQDGTTQDVRRRSGDILCGPVSPVIGAELRLLPIGTKDTSVCYVSGHAAHLRRPRNALHKWN